MAVAKHSSDKQTQASAVSVAALVYDGAGNFSASVYGFTWDAGALQLFVISSIVGYFV